MGNRIYLASPTMHQEEQVFIQEAFDTNWVAPLGKNVDEFEKGVAEFVGVKSAAALNAGTAALHLAVKLAGVRRGDKVVRSSLTASGRRGIWTRGRWSGRLSGIRTAAV